MPQVTQTVSWCVDAQNQGICRYQDTLGNNRLAAPVPNFVPGAAGVLPVFTGLNAPAPCTAFSVTVTYNRVGNTVNGNINSSASGGPCGSGSYTNTNPSVPYSAPLTPFGGNCSGFSVLSDVALKHNFSDIDRGELLQKLMQLPIQSWNFIFEQTSVRHIGPTAQDFRALFPYNGDNDTEISVIDSNGVTLAAIQALYALLEKQGRELDELRAELAEFRTKKQSH